MHGGDISIIQYSTPEQSNNEYLLQKNDNLIIESQCSPEMNLGLMKRIVLDTDSEVQVSSLDLEINLEVRKTRE